MNKKAKKNKLGRWLIRGFLGLCVCMALLFSYTPKSEAGCGCTGCWWGDVPAAIALLRAEIARAVTEITRHMFDETEDHKDWLTDEFFKRHIFPTLSDMTVQLVSVGMQQVATIGMFMDAEQQMETQRLFQELQNEAHKDYQPSEDFCAFGTTVRSVASSEQLSRQNALALDSLQMARHLSKQGSAGSDTGDNDKLVRWNQWKENYCDPNDNNKVGNDNTTGLTPVCGNGGSASPERLNIDIDFTRLIEEPRTLDLNFFYGRPATNDQEDVTALGQNLYGHDPPTRDVNKNYLDNEEYQALYLALRSVAAKRNVAQNSYNAIVGMKSSGSSDPLQGAAPNTRDYLGAVIKELGVPENEIYELIGTNPSYYAQLEILAKKIYQSPDFFANLYDKPANVQRKAVALKAIDLMLDRAIYESQLRQEMAMSVLLSSKLDHKLNEEAEGN